MRFEARDRITYRSALMTAAVILLPALIIFSLLPAATSALADNDQDEAINTLALRFRLDDLATTFDFVILPVSFFAIFTAALICLGRIDRSVVDPYVVVERLPGNSRGPPKFA